MSELDDKMREFEKKIEDRQADLEKKLEADLAALFGKVTKPPAPRDPSQSLREPPAVGTPQFASGAPLVNAQIDITGLDPLRAIDEKFMEVFQIRRFIPGADVRYQTIYAETLEEFIAPMCEAMAISTLLRAALIDHLKAEAERDLKAGRGVTFGVNLPDRGCYVNGWIFARLRELREKKPPSTPREALDDPAIFPAIAATVVHEKLGHGFLTDYTAMGEEKKRLGSARLDLARRFELPRTDSPSAAVFEQKHNLVYTYSMLAEEGWATWIEASAPYWLQSKMGDFPGGHYTVDQVLAAIEKQKNDPSKSERAGKLRRALEILFKRDQVPYDELHAAVRDLDETETAFDHAISKEINQTLRYTVGYLLVEKLANNAGWQCAPFGVMIAANLSYDLDKVSLSDLEKLVSKKPLLCVDTRLAIISNLKLKTRGDVRELAAWALEVLGMGLPTNLKV